jgi:peptide/nickel transport system substrate-binding protein
MASGPYEFKSWTPGQQIVLVRNPNYWNPAYRAHAAQVTLKFVTDATALAEGLASGELDAAWEIPPAVIPHLKTSTSGNVFLGPSPIEYQLCPMRSGGPLANMDLRKALMVCIDRNALATAILYGAGQANYTMMPPYTWYPAAEAAWSNANQEWVKVNAYNFAEAKRLVAASGYKGQPIEMIIGTGNTTITTMAEYIQAQAKLAGMNIKITSLQPVPLDNAEASPSARKGVDLSLTIQWNGARDPLEPLGFDIYPNPWNWPDYVNPTVIALANKARETFDPAQRTALLIRAQSIYEPAYAYNSIVVSDEICYLKKGLAGMDSSFDYLWRPALALIGSAQ